MSRRFDLSCSFAVLVAWLLATLAGAAEVGPPPRVVETPKGVWVESSLPTAGKNIRQLAFDGNDKTYFRSSRDAVAGDTFTIRFEPGIKVNGVSWNLSSEHNLRDVVFENSLDGTDFKPPGGTNVDDEIRAFRVRVLKDLKQPLTILEFKPDAEGIPGPFKHPVEFSIDVADAPEMREWVETTVRICESQYPIICDLLASKDYEPPTQVRLTMKKDYKGVAAAGGGRITGSVDFFRKNPDDRGAFVHETVHIVQNYRQRGLPSWLVEGIADYIRFWIYEPGKAGRVNPDRAKYDGSYRTTASFLAFVTDKYEPALVTKLNAALREGTYEVGVWKKLTGKTVEELNTEWKTSLRE